MLAKILLIFPLISNSKTEIRYPPFGLLEIASYLKSKNISVDIYDRNIEFNSLDRLMHMVATHKYDYIGISAMFIQKDDAETILCMLNDCKAYKVVLGGDYFTTFKERFKNVADYIICGEGELFFENMVENSIGKDIIQYSTPIKCLDTIPIPNKTLLDQVAWDKRVFSLKTSRGCPFECIFCSSTNNARSVRYYSSEYIINYIRFIYEMYGIAKFRFMDDIFTLNRTRVLQFCDQLINSNLPVEITECFSHVSVCDKNIFDAMKNAKFRSIQIGIESANNEVLKIIGKNTTRDNIENTVYSIVESGLAVEGLYMMGNIGDTAQTIKETIEFARNLPTYKDWFSFACPLPNSRFFRLAQMEGTILDDDYSHYTNAEVVYVPNGMTKGELEQLMKLAQSMVREKMINRVRKRKQKT